jgi:DNA-binding response OmpR family regulator
MTSMKAHHTEPDGSDHVGAAAGPHHVEPARVLVVDTDPSVEGRLRPVLEAERFVTRFLADGAEVLDVVRTWDPVVIVLNPVLPDADGIELCRTLRTISDAYVILLSERDGEVDTIIGLSVGADDYMTKPFREREVVARAKAMLRRPRGAGAPGAEASVRRFGDLSIDPMGLEVSVAGRQVALTPLEFKILDTLTSNPRVVFTRANLIERVWGPNWFGGEHVVDVHVSNLRRKLASVSDDPYREFLRTVRGHGYRFVT